MFKAKRLLPLTEYGWEIVSTVFLLASIVCVAMAL